MSDKNRSQDAQPASDKTGPLREFRSALAALSGSQKSSRGAPAYSRFVNRPMGRVIAAAAFVLGLTPNRVTVISAILTFSGIVILASVPPALPMAVAVTFLLVFGYAADAADGQLARLRGSSSPSGEWLDHVVDAIKSSTLHAAVLISWFRFFDLESVTLLIPLAYQVITAVFFFAMILTDQLRRLQQNSTGMIVKKNGSVSALYALAVVPADHGLLCLTFLLFAWQPVFIVVYGLLFLANLLIVSGSLWRWFREMKRLG